MAGVRTESVIWDRSCLISTSIFGHGNPISIPACEGIYLSLRNGLRDDMKQAIAERVVSTYGDSHELD